MILRRSMLDQIGLLDEGLYTYFDDIDICLRARRAGWDTWYVPESKIIHLEGASTGVTGAAEQVLKRRPEYWFQARRRFFLKSHGKLYTALADAAFLAGQAIWRVRRRIQRKPDTDPPHMLGDAFRHSVFRTGFELRDVENPALRERSGRRWRPIRWIARRPTLSADDPTAGLIDPTSTQWTSSWRSWSCCDRSE